MEFGMFHEFPSLPGRGENEAFQEALAQVEAAERLGLDVMWLASSILSRTARCCRRRSALPAQSPRAPGASR